MSTLSFDQALPVVAVDFSQYVFKFGKHGVSPSCICCGKTVSVPGTQLVCILFRHADRESWLIQGLFPAALRRSDENSACAIYAPE